MGYHAHPFIITLLLLLFAYSLLSFSMKPREFPDLGSRHVAQLGSTSFYEKNRSLQEQFWIFVNNIALLLYKLALLIIGFIFLDWIMD